LLDNPPCGIVMPNLLGGWDIEAIYNHFCSLDDKSLCIDSSENYIVQLLLMLVFYYDRASNKSRLCIFHCI
jgi:hypothetical protein